MSLILDALSRAERDKRSREGVPDLLAPAEAPAPSPLRIAGAAAAVLVAVILAVVAASWWWQGRAPTPAQEPAPGAARSSSATAESPRAALAPAAASRAGGSARVDTPASPAEPSRGAQDGEAIAALYSRAPAAAGDGEASAEDSPGETPGGGAAANNAADPERLEARESAPAAKAAPASEERPIDLEQLLVEARRASANSGLSDHPVPVLGSLSQQYRDRVPTLMYLRHDYSRSAAEASVLINGETLREGQRLGSVQVVEILPDSVILRFEGQDFRLRALNSWINL